MGTDFSGRWEVTSRLLCLPSEKQRSILKRNEFAPQASKLFPFRTDSFFRTDLLCRKANRKFKKLSPIKEMMNSLLIVSVLIKINTVKFILIFVPQEACSS